MKTKKRIISTIGAVALLVTSLVGCTSKSTNNDGGKTSISVGNWPNEQGNQSSYQLYNNMKMNFEKLNSNIEIVPDEWGYDVKTFLPKAEGGTLPIIYTSHFTEADKIIGLGYAQDLSEYVKKYGYYNKLSDFVVDKISRDGKIFFVPESVYSLGLMLNLDLFEQAGLMEADGTPKAPKTFDELIETAKTITEKTGKAGFIFPTTENAGGWNFTALAWNFGTKFMEQKDGKWVATFNSPQCAQALQYLQDLKWKYKVLPENTLVNNNETMKSIGTGQAGMTFAHPGQAKQPVANYGLSKDSLGFAQMPAGKNNHVTLIGGNYRAISNKASDAQIDAAFKWLEFVGVSPNMNEDSKKQIESNYNNLVENNLVVGIKDLSVWTSDSEVQAYRNQLIDEKCNININHVKLYNDKENIDYQTEEPVCAQDLYAVLDKCIQKVLTDENADCATILEQAANEFQKNYLDYEN